MDTYRNRLRSVPFLLAVALLLCLPALVSPVPGGMLASFLPLPFVMMTRRHGVAWGILLAGLFGIAFALATNPLTAAHTVMVQGGAGILIGWSAARRRPILEQTTLAAGIPLLAAAIFSLPPFPELLGPSWTTLPDQIDQGMRLWRDLAVGGSAIQTDAGALLALVEPLFPGFNVVGMLINCLLCSVLAGLMPPAGRDPGRPLLRDLRLPSWLTWAFILTGFALLRGMSPWLGIPAGVMVVLLFHFLIQGFAVAVHKADRWRVGMLPRLFFAVMLLVQPIGLAMLCTLLLLGLVDFRFDFRKERPGAPPA